MCDALLFERLDQHFCRWVNLAEPMAQHYLLLGFVVGGISF